MIFTKIYIDNLYSFNDALLDLTIPREVKRSTIPNESLLGRPKFRYKKVCIFTGGNSSGKTSIAKVMLTMQNFITNKIIHSENIERAIYDKEKNAIIDIEFATVNDCLAHKLYLELDKKGNIVSFSYASIKILKNESANGASKRLSNTINSIESTNYVHLINENTIQDINSALLEFKKVEIYPAWYYIIPSNEEVSQKTREDTMQQMTAGFIENILKTFDPSIKNVNPSFTKNSENKEEINGFLIRFKNDDSVLINLNGDMPDKDKERLSKGTFEAIVLCPFIFRINQAYKIATETNNNLIPNSIYFLDEKMAYSHSIIEQTIINFIIMRLAPNSQFFYTTHNSDILRLNLPIHTFCFLKKEGEKTEFINPEKTFKKNDRNFANYVENDIFGAAPDTSGIDILLNSEE